MITCPTAEEIRAAHDAIVREGPISEASVELCSLALCDPTLRAVLDQTAGAAPAFGARLVSVLAGVFANGLNHGLRIGEARAAAPPAADTPETAAEKGAAAQRVGELLRDAGKGGAA